MNKLVEEIIKPILEENSKITKVVGIFGGRFQPFGPHHKKAYEWLAKQFDDAYITTSNIKKLPRHPMNFKEKVRHMSKMGISSSKIVMEKTPFVAKNLEKKFDPETTAFVYIFGKKDTGRLGGKYFQDFKKNKNNLKGFKEHGYYLVAPHMSVSAGGLEVSGTAMRELLGSEKYKENRKKLFKKMFGYFDQGVYNMMTNKFSKIFEDADIEFKPKSMYYVPKKKKPLNPKFKDGKKRDLIKGWIEEGVPVKVKKALGKYVPSNVISNNTKLISWIQKNPMLINQLLRLATEGKLEEVKLPIKIGDTVRMGKFKNKKVVIKSIDWNEKGDLLINGRPALKFRITKESIADFVRDTDIINEVTQLNTAAPIDDGPAIFAPSVKSYRKQAEDEAGRIGWHVISYLMDDEYDIQQQYRIYPDGPINSVSFGPSGVQGQAGTEDLTGSEAWTKWSKHISKIIKSVGWKYIDYLGDEKDTVLRDTDATEDALEDEMPPETPTNRNDIQHTKPKKIKESVQRYILIEDMRVPLDEGVKFNEFLKDFSKKAKQPFDQVKKAMSNKSTYSIAKLNDFSVDKVFENSKKGYKAVANVIKYVPKKIAQKINNTVAGKKKDEALKKVDDWLKKHPKTKRAVMLGAAGAVTYMWTQMTFIGEPEYDFDLSGVAGAAAGTATLSDLFGGTGGTKFLGLFVAGKAAGLSFPWPGKNISKFAVGITYGAYKLKKHNDKKRTLAAVGGKEDKLKDLPKKVANPNPNGWRKQVSLNSAVSWISKNKGAHKAKVYLRKLRKQKNEVFSKDWWKENLLTEGGAYGHMAHPFDDKDLTFGDLKKIIEDGLGGQLSREDNVTEKLDGQNIMISWKDGKLIAARNKGHIKNGGKTALDTKGIISKFKGRGDIRNAFVFAMKDLEKALKSLSQKQKDKIFNNGYNFMNMEIMWPKSANVIDYDVAELVFHGALIYNDAGVVKGEVKGSARILAGMIEQRNQNIQKKYKIGKPNFLTVPKHQDFGKMKSKFVGKLNKLKNEYGLKDNDKLALYHQSYWEEYIYNAAQQFKYNIPDSILKNLTKRWAFFDKSYKIPTIRKELKDEPDFLDWVLSTDKNDHSKMVKENMKPFEVLFFEVGAEILKNVQGFIAVNPDKAVQGMKTRIDKAISDVKSGGDLKKLNTLKLQLDKLNKIGGVDSIVPSEGIVFKYKGNTYKFTGAFAPINQIAGLISF